jgi:hypothetical protein
VPIGRTGKVWVPNIRPGTLTWGFVDAAVIA